jgi:hypothetical protein
MAGSVPILMLRLRFNASPTASSLVTFIYDQRPQIILGFVWGWRCTLAHAISMRLFKNELDSGW